MKPVYLFIAALTFGGLNLAPAQSRTASLRLSFANNLGPLNIDHIALGQGGLSEYPMWDDRVAEIRALHPRLIRLFVQEYFDLLPAPGTYHFDTLDQSMDLIARAGARPLLSIAFKPKALFPVVDQDIVEPQDYRKWEELIYTLVTHYKQRGLTGLYWEVGNEPDIGEDGGCPYRFKPDNYTRYYQHTISAILRADPTARVGGPALAGWKSPILPALLAFCAEQKVPLHFISWHIYDSNPSDIQDTIQGVKTLLASYPALKPETILDEWNMALTVPPKNPQIQPCFIAETAWRMKESGLDYSCYYHIRDYHVDRDRFAKFFSLHGASFMAAWWNRMPQYDGLFDYQNVMRPSYFTFQLLSRLTGDRLAVESSDKAVHAFLTYDKSYDIYSLLVWNFSADPVSVEVDPRDLPLTLVAKRRQLDAASPSSDENARLRPLDDLTLKPGSGSVKIQLEPFGVEFWSLEKTR
jgi:hypothetical protein